MRCTGIGALLCILMILLNIAAIPRLAIALNEDRTYDQAHDSGYIDWNVNAQYVYLGHKDGTSLPPEEGGTFCGSGCYEWVTRIGNGGSVSGAFARDVTYFEVMVAFTRDASVGSAILSACGSTANWYLYNTGGSLPGFVSMILTVPAGCRIWSLSASGGYVDFRSVDVLYVAAPPPTLTPTSMPTFTFTSTPSRTPTRTPTPIPTFPFTPTSSLTTTPTNTYTFTPYGFLKVVKKG